MLFNSIDFAWFLPAVFAVYWSLSKAPLRWQNILITVASYVFYGWWDWRFLTLIFFSTVVDFAIGRALSFSSSQKRRMLLLAGSLVVNLGLLGFFKYFNWFLDSLSEAFTLFGQPLELRALDIVLPVGISFYTFQTLSYTIDVYRKKLEPTRSFIDFVAYVSFFPQLVAGPIERASNLLPQFAERRSFSYKKGVEGLRQILWGLFKKVVIADNCAQLLNPVFDDPAAFSGTTLLAAAILFAFQIYGDFSGYSDIAIGTARLFGFQLMQNFRYPYFSRDIAEFWRRWHISLSTWFRDYLYIPLGGSRGSRGKQIRNVFIIFVVSGVWHGANWTFAFWGLLNALYFLPLLLRNQNRKHLDDPAEGRRTPTLREIFSILATFLITTIAWVFFRAASISDALSYLAGIVQRSVHPPEAIFIYKLMPVAALIALMLSAEWIWRRLDYPLQDIELRLTRTQRWTIYLLLIVCIGLFAVTEESPFIYFQF